jgi:predicted amidohydrolase
MPDLAARLGVACLNAQPELQKLRDHPGTREVLDSLHSYVARLDSLLPGPDGSYLHLMEDEGFRSRVERLDPYPGPLDYLGTLLGLQPHLRRLYDNERGQIPLRPGLPIPIASRGVNQLYPVTPEPQASHLNSLLTDPSLFFFNPGHDSSLPVVLDYRVRDRLDELTWGDDSGEGRPRLPRVATVHPHLGREGVTWEAPSAATFFGVRPANWDLDQVLGQLRSARDKAEIAVLPELSLPEADALELGLSADPGAYPPLVVAGSAHLREAGGEGEIRANESRVYLDGECIFRHRKARPFRMSRLPDGTKLASALTEDLTHEPKTLTVLASEYTRLAVMICSDLIETDYAQLLQKVGVNLLVIPAMTPSPATFAGDVGTLASHCQGVSVVVNVDGAMYRGIPRPFMVLAAAPHRSGGLSHEYRRRFGRSPAVGIFDPNKKSLLQAMKWNR